ncbi:hypothetical protein BFJ72_g13469 [Fusarium proliferatum]|uniref:Uncharacterized protein n=1 Tax=Gibberella intermedia TaxID=948311 RepID=A0A420SCG6_GIBIN|nr:hypothetical protein BFJ72_g13469 [Fusarium proliferatum]
MTIPGDKADSVQPPNKPTWRDRLCGMTGLCQGQPTPRAILHDLWLVFQDLLTSSEDYLTTRRNKAHATELDTPGEKLAEVDKKLRKKLKGLIKRAEKLTSKETHMKQNISEAISRARKIMSRLGNSKSNKDINYTAKAIDNAQGRISDLRSGDKKGTEETYIEELRGELVDENKKWAKKRSEFDERW